MKFKIRNRLEFLLTYCPDKKIEGTNTYEKVSTEICYRKCEYAKTYIRNAEMLIGKEVTRKDLKLLPWEILCVKKEQENWPGSIFDVYKR